MTLNITVFVFQSGLDRTVLVNFIQLRSDYKTAKLGNQLKWDIYCLRLEGEIYLLLHFSDWIFAFTQYMKYANL